MKLYKRSAGETGVMQLHFAVGNADVYMKVSAIAFHIAANLVNLPSVAEVKFQSVDYSLGPLNPAYLDKVAIPVDGYAWDGTQILAHTVGYIKQPSDFIVPSDSFYVDVTLGGGFAAVDWVIEVTYEDASLTEIQKAIFDLSH
jgi:hypothetical protein